MYHHTKDKGDIGVAKVISNLMCKGIQVCLPISEHLPFDLIAVSEKMKCYRIQDKYRSLSKNNIITLKLSNSYSDSKGVHIKRINLDTIDFFAIYCPEIDCVFYISSKECNNKKYLTFRTNNPNGCNQYEKAKIIEDYMNINI